MTHEDNPGSSWFCIECGVIIEVRPGSRCPRCGSDVFEMRTDKIGRRVLLRYCSCTKVVHGNGAWTRHLARHRRLDDGHCAVTAEQFKSLLQASRTTTITEQLSPPPRGDDEARAANILVRAGAQFVDEALVDNPDGPVRMHAELSRTGITYEVTIGNSSDLDGAIPRVIWHRVVTFGHADRTAAGDDAFEAARAVQESVAQAALDLLEERR